MNRRRFKTAFILGAGLGTRLRPLTARCPKPLLDIGGRPLITYIMDNLVAIGVDRLIVNTHRCSEVYTQKFPDHQWRGVPIIFSHEPILLDTGGGLKNIEGFLEEDEAIICCNGKLITDLPLIKLIERHEQTRPEATLVLRSQGFPLNVDLDENGHVCDIRHILGKPGVRSYLFASIYAVEKSFLRHLQPGRIESVVDAFVRRIREEPGSIRGIVLDEGSWEDVSNIEVYKRVTSRFAAQSSGSSACGSAVPLHQAAGNSAAPTQLNRTVTKTELELEMLGFAREALGLSEFVVMNLVPFQGGGSDRCYFRLSWASHGSAILVHYDPRRVENAYFADIAAFLNEIEVAVPRVIRHDPNRCLVLTEDLGDTDLWSLREAPWETRGEMYRQTLDVVHRLHSFPEESFPSDQLRLMESFGPDLYQWEREYFKNNFVRSVCGIVPDPDFEQALEAELSALAARLDAAGRCLVHRDLQSRNVMIYAGRPFLIDFQGMRFGSPFYDLGSLLCDPYVRFCDEEREELLAHSFRLSGRCHDRGIFLSAFWEASVQRLMQALGAYGFLSCRKGITAYFGHIPAGLDNLQRATERVESLPHLRDLCVRCRQALGNQPLKDMIGGHAPSPAR